MNKQLIFEFLNYTYEIKSQALNMTLIDFTSTHYSLKRKINNQMPPFKTLTLTGTAIDYLPLTIRENALHSKISTERTNRVPMRSAVTNTHLKETVEVQGPS